ncbi:uncharacterized protein K444DRAFT_604537 [Hyaloscypha bicolor E]|uniref:DUF6594 domain-containing protein n=1 Tax=Hyaloscypha bicolor E TaxID=1095630 RepID=A0A2J6SH29_9HELO|nr:uncharacterized protein K444DRAFT_604537 [Hyaloscypha bicolor E]PMD50082.1 hypothetical protein K444DRAFT_604537 [Hyaloscypha bicolor E]
MLETQSLSITGDGTTHITTHQLPIESQILTQKEVDAKPWKFIGYPGYSSFLASETDLLIFRRFGATSARIALKLQDNVVVLEEELSKLDGNFARREAKDVQNGSFRIEQPDREKVMNQLHNALLEYNAFMLQQVELRKFPPPSEHDVENISNWHWNHSHCAISKEEQQYLTHVHDLFSLVPRIKTPLRRLVDKSRSFKMHWLWRQEKVPQLPLYDREEIFYVSDRKIDRLMTVIIITIGTVMLIAPMWILWSLKDANVKLGTITACMLFFLGLVSYTTVAKPFETLAATAAYAAVLMVFLQLGTTNSHPIAS